MSKSINALAGLIALIHGDRAATIASMGEAFASDYGHFARSNNREPLNIAAKALGKLAKDKAIGEALTAGYKAGALVQGYIGAQSGKFASQPDDVRAVFDNAVITACEAFVASLEACEAFADKVPKTADEKAKAKADKAMADAINAKIQAGELVRADGIKPLSEFGALALVEALQGIASADGLSDVAVSALRAMVSYGLADGERETLTAIGLTHATRMHDAQTRIDALTAERDAITSERDALVHEKAQSEALRTAQTADALRADIVGAKTGAKAKKPATV